MSFHEVLFPDSISASSSFGPTFKTLISELPSGKEQRIPIYEQAKHRIEVQMESRTLDDLYAVKEFALMRNGSAFGFRIRDRSDYNTTSSGRASTDSNGAAHTMTDQNIGTGDGVQTVFQLTKRYSDGVAPNVVRSISKPRSGTILVAVAGVLSTEGSDYTINYSTGEVLFTTIPTTGQAVTWGGEFDVPVRFDQSVESFLSTTISDFDNGSMGSLSCIEIIDEVAGVSDFYPGGSNTFSFGANAAISIAGGRVKVLKATTTGLMVFLPDPTSPVALPLGVDWFTIIGDVGTSSFSVVTSDGGTNIVATIAAGDIFRIGLIKDTSGVVSWYADS